LVERDAAPHPRDDTCLRCPLWEAHLSSDPFSTI
jgi:hypothetical protein